MTKPTLKEQIEAVNAEAHHLHLIGANLKRVVLLRAAAETLRACEWRPADTAPRDGTSILALIGDPGCPAERMIVYWDDGTFTSGPWAVPHGLRYSAESLAAWMPLPPMPKPVPWKEEA